MLCAQTAHAQEEQTSPAADPVQSVEFEQPTTTNSASESTAEQSSDLSLPRAVSQQQADGRPTAPDVYLLPDEFGKLRKVLGFHYDDFLEAWTRANNGSTVSPPEYIIDAINISGRLVANSAKLRIEIDVSVQSSGWLRVPVRLPNFIVQKATIENESEGEALAYDAQQRGHVVWLTAQGGKQRRIVIEGLAKLKTNAGTQGVELLLPRATTAQFNLQLPDSNARFKTSPELTMTVKASEDGMTEVRLLGQAEPFRLFWTPAVQVAPSQSALLEVDGQTTVELNRRRVSYETTLSINSFEKPVTQIQVQLPKGAVFQQDENSSEYQYSLVESQSGGEQRQIVEIRMPEPRKAPWKVSLSAEGPVEPQSEAAETVIEGFEVLNAFRQSGSLTLSVDDSLQAYFDRHGAIDQKALLPSDQSSENLSLLGRFRYSRFPWHLKVHTSPRQKRVNVRPQYNLSINSDSAQLDIEFDYQFTGAQIFSVLVNLHGWKLTEAPIDSGGLVDRDQVVETQDDRLVLPLVDSGTQQLRLKFSLRKESTIGENVLVLPEPIGAFVVDGELAVDATDALQVTPNFDEMVGLSLISAIQEPAVQTPVGQTSRSTDTIRLRTFLARPTFVAEVSQRPRQLSVSTAAVVDIDQEKIKVLQQLTYDSKYRPISQVVLEVPASLAANNSLTVMLAGQLLPIGLRSNQAEATLSPTADVPLGDVSLMKELIVSLPRPMHNLIPLELAYELPSPTLTTDELTSIVLPLATSRSRVGPCTVSVVNDPSLLVSANQRSGPDAWQVNTAGNGESSETNVGLQLRTDENVSFLSLYAQVDSADREQLATLERAWIQTWIALDRRQERAVFRFRSPHSMAFVQLPSMLGSADVEVLLDGKPANYERLPAERLAIKLSNEAADIAVDATGSTTYHTLELRYQQDTKIPSWGPILSTPPQLDCNTTSAPIYYQLVLPRGWQLLSEPDQLVADYWLGWKNYRWGRQPTLSQPELEQLTNAITFAEPPPLSTQYVFRAFEVPAELQITVVRQLWLLMACASVAFGIGLLWLYTTLAQRGVFWLGVSISAFFGIYSYPEIALLAMQVILVGGLMTFSTSILRRAFATNSVPDPSPVSLQPDAQSAITDTWQQRQLDGSGDALETTATLHTSEPAS